MVTKKIKVLEVARAKVAALEAAIAAQLDAELSSLPEKYGYQSAKEFVKAVMASSGGRKTRAKSVKAPKATKGGKRARITDETRESVKKMVGEGKTGAVIAKELGISLPSVQNIKKALGLVRARQ